MDAGLRTLPGTAAEILDDEVRARPVPRQDQHRGMARRPPRPPTRSACAPTSRSCSASVEQPRTGPGTSSAPGTCRSETGGFTEFVPLPFVHMAAPIYLQRKARRGPTFREVVLMHAVGRIAYHGWIDNIQASWVKLGAAGRSQLLQAGVNDLGGTLMDENISRAAGASHGQRLDEERLPGAGRAARPPARAAHHALRPRRPARVDGRDVDQPRR